MKFSNWTVISFYSILLLSLVMIPSGQSALYNQQDDLNHTSVGDIFETPATAKKECPDDRKWIEGKCRFIVD